MTFDDVIQAVKARPGQSFAGIELRADGRYLSVFTVSVCEDDDSDPERVSIQFEGGLLFSDSGDEGFYSLADAPGVVKVLTYRPSTSLPDIAGLCSEYVLHSIFPQLPDPEEIWEEYERRAFIAQGLAAARASGFVTVTESAQRNTPARITAGGAGMSYGARIPFGEREGTLYLAHEVDNGLACRCLCPACRHPLIAANRGTKVIPYFRHAADSDCVEGFLKGVLMKARDIVMQAKRLMLPEFDETVRDYAYSKVYTKQVQFPAVEVLAEEVKAPVDEGGMEADLALWVKEHRLLVIFELAGRATSGKIRPLREAQQASIVINLSGLELKTIHDHGAFQYEVLGNPGNRRWLYSPRGERAVVKARKELKAVREEREAEAIRAKGAKEKEHLPPLTKASRQSGMPIFARETEPNVLPKPQAAMDHGAQQVRLRERIQAISDSYRQVLIQTGGRAQECGRCLMASPVTEAHCPYCGEASQFSPLEVNEDLASTILHRLRCSTRPDRSLERVPQLLTLPAANLNSCPSHNSLL